MSSPTLKQLRYFDALARHRHFGRAAEACAISQPALSMQIKELEELLDAELVDRGARAVHLTKLGEAMAERGRAILLAVDELVDLARASKNALTGDFKIGVIPTVAPYLLPTVITRLAEAHPGLEIHVRETVTPTLINELKDGRLDTAILALPTSEHWLEEVTLFRENFLLVRPKAEAGQPVPDSDMLREMRLLLLEEGHCFREQALSFCNLRSGSPREALDASSLSTLVQMVSAGIGVTLIPEMAIPVETRSADVAISRFDEPQPARTIGMVWRKTSPLAEQLTGIADLIRPACSHAAVKADSAPYDRASA